MQKKEIGIGILGLGTIGSGILSLLEENRSFIEQETSPHKIKVIGLVDLDASRKPKLPINYQFFTDQAQEVLDHSEIQIVVEAIGGEYPAYSFVKQALEKGKHVVTPNKELIARHGYELLRIARQHNVQLLFETSVASAIPILGTMVNMLTSCPLDEISGILNGTTNYILDLMLEENISQQEALKKAQEMGYAEADPSKDINGIDTLYKIFILASLGFRGRLDLNAINYSGISRISLNDVKLAKQLGYYIKLLATARKKAERLNIRVQPILISDSHLLSKIRGAYNGISLSGNGYGKLFFSGPGAGGLAGASMIISDMIRIIKKPDSFEHDFLLADSSEFTVEHSDLAKHNYFFKITTVNNPENITAIIKALLQHGLGVEKSAELDQGDGTIILGLIVTPVKEDRLKKIILEMKKLNYIQVIDYLQIY